MAHPCLQHKGNLCRIKSLSSNYIYEKYFPFDFSRLCVCLLIFLLELAFDQLSGILGHKFQQMYFVHLFSFLSKFVLTDGSFDLQIM
jgi:hypothetical protein